MDDGDVIGIDDERGQDAAVAASDTDAQASHTERGERSASVRRGSAVKEALRPLLDSGLGVFGPENCRTFSPHYS